MRGRFRKVGNGSLAHNRNVAEPVESSLCFDLGGVRRIRLDGDNQSRWPDSTSAHEAVKATMRANIKKRTAARENLGNRPLDQRFERPEPILRHDVAFGTPPSQALRVAQVDRRHAPITMERKNAQHDRPQESVAHDPGPIGCSPTDDVAQHKHASLHTARRAWHPRTPDRQWLPLTLSSATPRLATARIRLAVNLGRGGRSPRESPATSDRGPHCQGRVRGNRVPRHRRRHVRGTGAHPTTSIPTRKPRFAIKIQKYPAFGANVTVTSSPAANSTNQPLKCPSSTT